jgi:hypothetical protein
LGVADLLHIFRKYHDNGIPVILDYEDAFYYIEQHPDQKGLSIKNAIALHLFHIKLRQSMQDRERDENKRMSRDETDSYIRYYWGARELDEYIEYADKLLRSYTRDMERDAEKQTKSASRAPILSGMIIGVAGNAATLFVGYLIGIAFAIYTKDNVVIGTLSYLNKCFNTSFMLP